MLFLLLNPSFFAPNYISHCGVAKKVAVLRTKVTASDALMSIIKGSRKGIDSTTLQRKTGFNNQKIRDNIFKLTKQGKIKRVGRGIYIAK
jgi:predicted transcriptional regulator of viral defense system